jgi:predicted metalloprotease
MRIDENERQSSNLDDRRGSGNTGGMMGGKRGIGIGSIVIAAIAYFVFGINPMTTLGVIGGGTSEPVQQAPTAANKNDPTTKLINSVLVQTEEVWGQVFKEQGKQYAAPRLTIFSGRTNTACGPGDTASGPFYCPADKAVYIDPQFYRVMRERMGAPGDFAQAYVIAHEVGHHIQNVLGIMDKMEQAKQRNPKLANQLSVRLELQADCFAGVWARRTESNRKVLEPGDIEEAMNAAAAVGDDKLQGSRARPETFTHGTSAQRMQWFKRGFEGGNMGNCNTFAGA